MRTTVPRTVPRDDPTPEQIAAEWRLVAAAQAGDADAFAALYTAYLPVVTRTLKARLISLPEVVQDLTGDTFVSAWRSIRLLREVPGKSPVGWFVRIAMNKSVDYLKRCDTRLTRSVDPGFFDYDHKVPVEDRWYMVQDWTAATVGRRHAIRVAMAELPATQREALGRRYVGGQSIAEIQADMGLPTFNAAKQLLDRARRSLRTRLACHRDALLSA